MAGKPTYKLYHYWRSSSSWRVRWALEIKKAETGISYTPVDVSLLNGESESPEHLARNPAGFVPVLEIPQPGGAKPLYLVESLAIIDYLDAIHPGKTNLVPKNPLARAKVWALAEIVASGTQPIQNPPVAEFHSADPAERKRWNQHWIRNGLEIYEKSVRATAGEFSFGNSLTLADLCLMPQIYNAERFEVPFRDLPAITGIYEKCVTTPTYQASHPDRFKPAD